MRVSTTALLSSGVAPVIYGTTAGTAATGNDYRFAGIERIDLRAGYGAPLDGNSHPLSTMGLAAAQALYPNAGLTSSTDLTKFEQDTAAFIQAEYDLRTGSNGRAMGGIIGLPDNAGMMLSQPVSISDALRVWFHGGRLSSINTRPAGTSAPALTINAAYSNAVPLANLNFNAAGSVLYVPGNLGGTPHTSFVTGAHALFIQNTTMAEFYNLSFNAYDTPITWGDNVYCIVFRLLSSKTCNVGFGWSETGGLNSMERIIVEHSNLSNNNYGFDINATFTDSNGNVMAQGGSIFIKDSSIDYNVVRQGRYIGLPPNSPASNNGLYLIGNHVETSPACSGTSLARFYIHGCAAFDCNGFEDQGGMAPGLIEVADGSQISATNNRNNAGDVPIFYSSTSNDKTVSGYGNKNQYFNSRPRLLQDALGTLMQHDPRISNFDYNYDGGGLPLTLQGVSVINLFLGDGAGPYNFTINTDAAQNGQHRIGTRFLIMNCSGGPATIRGASGVSMASLNNHFTLPARGGFCWIQTYAANSWTLLGSQLIAP